jgi:deoxyribodipyrimidine photo-lyase
MSRDQRAEDNWALLAAVERAREEGRGIEVAFALAPAFLGATWRAYDFLLRGLRETESTLAEHGIPFTLLLGDPGESITRYVHEKGISAVITDFDPLRKKREWKDEAISGTDTPFIEVDAHNIVPAWAASVKKEFAARTFRPRIMMQIPTYLTDIPSLPRVADKLVPVTDWMHLAASLHVDRSVRPIEWCAPGSKAAMQALERFLSERIARYDAQRNDPMSDAQSDLSPYLHFGQISAQRIAKTISDAKVPLLAKESFLEELIVRRELSDNYCLYESAYDSPAGFPDWAKRSIAEHRSDLREHVYTSEDFENAKTHDPLWNAAQTEMVERGKMHGYLRMYWAKKILEWSTSVEEAMDVAVRLNDKYEIDGRDPNGYVGIAWSMGGVHDRAWFDRPVFGKIRYMNSNGCAKKFDVQAYIGRWGKLSP